ncbi:MAG: hypothetical protein P4L00_09385, partial [Candidatus Acidoferrales bacterium]|nr:hypothetical protein [Candidatus Acidoferrales bacterium]
MKHYIRALLTSTILLTQARLLRADPPASTSVPATHNGNNTFTGNNNHAGAEIFTAPDFTTFGAPTKGQGLWFAVTFTNSQQALLTMASRDGKRWGFVDSSGSYNGSGIIRDPSLIRLAGQWWMVNTRSSLSETMSFTVSSGPTMRELTVITNIDCSSISGISFTWAPQFFVSPGATDYTGVHVFFSAGANDSSMAIYEVHPTNSGMTAWSEPVAIAGTGFPPTMIDPYLLQIDSTYYLWFKNENNHHFGYATSSSLTNGYTTTSAHDGSTDWMNTGFAVEGTVVVPLGPVGVYRVYEDRYVGQGYYYQETTDSFATWSTPVKCQTPYPVSHWDIIRPSDANALMEILGDFVNDNQVITQVNGYVGIGGMPTYPFEVISPPAVFPQFGF